MAEVYRGYHASLDRFVAIKILHTFLAEDPEFKVRFEKEAQSVAKLKHPHIVQVYDFDYDSDSDSYYMVMEFIDGPSLRDYLELLANQGEHLPFDEVLRMIREAASALAYAHSYKMIHRDVKPANLMLDPRKRVILTDFGIAKIVSGPQYTATGGMMGTPAYMSPEQGMGQTGDERSDIYSLGVILYELLTGVLPYNAETPVALILRHLHDAIPLPSRTNRSLPKDVDDIILKSMAKEPNNRYQSAVEFIGDLERLELEHVAPIQMPAPKPGGSGKRSTLVLRSRPELPTGPAPESETLPPLPHRTPPWLLAASVAVMIVVVFGGFLLATRYVPIALLPSPTPTTSSTPSPIAVTRSPTPPPATTLVPVLTHTATAKPTDTVAPSPTNTLTFTPTITPSLTLTLTPTITLSPTPAISETPTPSPDFTQTQAVIQTSTIAACKFDYAVVENSPEDGTKGGYFKINADYERKITLLNTGSCAWEPNTSLTFIQGEDFNAGTRIWIRDVVNPAETVILTFKGKLPSRGRETPYSGVWELRTPGQIPIGKPLVISILVYDPGTGG